MLIKTSGPAPVEPTSLLKLVAGDFAPRVAALWPAPHAEFVTAPAARRHLVCMAFAFGRDVGPLRGLLLHERLKRAIPAVVGAAAQGLARALTRMGDVAWPADAYAKLVDLLGDRIAAKVLRHAPVIDAETVRRMAALPAAMSDGMPMVLALSGETVAALRETYDAIRLRSGAAAADVAAARWARTITPKALVEAVRDDLYPEPMTPPHPGTERLRPLSSKAAMRAAAARYRNCLRDNIPYAASGWSAYYEWEGEPNAVVEISRDAIFGWRLEQARLANNAPVPAALRDAIVSELALMGVHVGRSCWELDRALSAVDGRVFALRPLTEAVAEAFGD